MARAALPHPPRFAAAWSMTEHADLMAIPTAGRLIRRYPWLMFISCTVVAVVASLIRDLVHEPGKILAGEGVAIAVTLATGICAIWAFIVIMLRRRADSRAS